MVGEEQGCHLISRNFRNILKILNFKLLDICRDIEIDILIFLIIFFEMGGPLKSSSIKNIGLTCNTRGLVV